jgi:hypothetical protein
VLRRWNPSEGPIQYSSKVVSKATPIHTKPNSLELRWGEPYRNELENEEGMWRKISLACVDRSFEVICLPKSGHRTSASMIFGHGNSITEWTLRTWARRPGVVAWRVQSSSDLRFRVLTLISSISHLASAKPNSAFWSIFDGRVPPKGYVALCGAIGQGTINKDKHHDPQLRSIYCLVFFINASSRQASIWSFSFLWEIPTLVFRAPFDHARYNKP